MYHFNPIAFINKNILYFYLYYLIFYIGLLDASLLDRAKSLPPPTFCALKNQIRFKLRHFGCSIRILCYNVFIMKKVILIFTLTAMVLAMSLGLAACNSATAQGQLANLLNPHRHESFEYSVTSDYEGVSGTLNVHLDAYSKGDTITGLGSVEASTFDYDCVVVKSHLEASVDGIDYIIYYGCVYKLTTSSTTYMVPQRCFRQVWQDDDLTFEMLGIYQNDNTFKYTRKIGNKVIDNEQILKLSSGTKLDNNEFQQILRSVTTYGSGLNLSFITPIVTMNANEPAEVVTLNAVANSTPVAVTGTVFGEKYAVKNERGEEEYPYKENGIKCYKVTLSRSTQIEGRNETLYYASEEVKFNGWAISQPLIKFEEPLKKNNKEYTVTYSLVSANIQ